MYRLNAQRREKREGERLEICMRKKCALCRTISPDTVSSCQVYIYMQQTCSRRLASEIVVSGFHYLAFLLLGLSAASFKSVIGHIRAWSCISFTSITFYSIS